MIDFVGAGSGAPDLVTVRGKRLLEEADVIVYAGSLVNPALLSYARDNCRLYNSAEMTLEEILAVMVSASEAGERVVRLHTGDPSLYGAIREQMDALDERGIPYAVCPGVSSFLAAAASLKAEYTLPGGSQTVILTRMEGKTLVPKSERIEALAAHRATMVIFLSAGMLPQLTEKLLSGGYASDTPTALVYKASWPEEKIIRCPLGSLAKEAERAQIQKTALVLVGDFLGQAKGTSRLYAPDFETAYRKAVRE